MRQRGSGSVRPPSLLRCQRTVIAGLALAVSACSGTSSPPLEDVCQFRACVCTDTKAAFWQTGDPRPPLWAENGAPYCPPGFALRRSGEP